MRRRTVEEKAMIREIVQAAIEAGNYSDEETSQKLYKEQGIEISVPMLKLFRGKEGLLLIHRGRQQSRAKQVEEAAQAVREKALDGRLELERALGKARARVDAAATAVTEAHDALAEVEERMKAWGVFKP